jgi:hypothetical protein
MGGGGDEFAKGGCDGKGRPRQRKKNTTRNENGSETSGELRNHKFRYITRAKMHKML